MKAFHRLLGQRSAVTLIELFALCGFAFVLPVLGALGETPEFFLFRRASPADILIFVAALAVIPPTFLWCVERVMGMASPPAAARVHRVLLGSLGIAVLFGVLRAITPLQGVWFLTAAALLAALVAPVIVRYGGVVRLWLRYVAVAAVGFMVLFLVRSPSGDLIRPSYDEEPRSPQTARSPLVMVVFDEFPVMSLLDHDGRIDARLFPNFAALARDSTFFRNTTSVAARTPFAVPAILTGRFATRSLAPTATAYPRSLFTLLARSHEPHIFESITAVCPRTVCEESPQVLAPDVGLRALHRDGVRVWLRGISFKKYDDDPAGLWLKEATAADHRRRMGTVVTDPTDAWFLAGRMQENQPARFRDFLASIDGLGRPLHFLHIILPHSPWEYLPDGARYSHVRLGYVEGEERNDQKWPALFDHQRHLLQVAYVDRLLGEVLDRLREIDLYDRSTVVVVADHGISFTTGPGHLEREFGPVTAAEVAWVPFLLKEPGQQEGQIRDDNVMTVDVLPTVADALDVNLSWQTDGFSVLSRQRQDDRKVFYNHPGQPIHFRGSKWFRAVRRGVIEDLLRPAEGVEGMFKMGPFADLIGTPVSSHTVLPNNASRVFVDGLEKFQQVDPEAGTVPALISGSVDSSEEDSRVLGVAVALNGTVAGSSQLFREGNTPRKFASMLVPWLFRAGQDRLEIFLLVGDAHRPSLLPVTVGD